MTFNQQLKVLYLDMKNQPDKYPSDQQITNRRLRKALYRQKKTQEKIFHKLILYFESCSLDEQNDLINRLIMIRDRIK